MPTASSEGVTSASVGHLAEAIRSRRISSEEIVLAHLNRIDAVNRHLNAVVQIRHEAALAEARNADRALASGAAVGPLHGVPFTAKDTFDAQGVISTAGTVGRRAYVPTRDATVITRIKRAGGILLGKTNTSELALSSETDNLVYGRTNNPYDLNRTPGGSGGGGAAIVAAGGSPFDLGSDMAGSLRAPAHFCGVVTLKPTHGRIPRTGHTLTHDPRMQVGPITRCVRDLVLLLPILEGPDDHDPAAIPMPEIDPAPVDLRGIRAAVYVDDGMMPADHDTRRHLCAVLEVLRSSGVAVVEARPDFLDDIKTLRRFDRGRIRRALEAAGSRNIHPDLDWIVASPPAARAAEEYGELLERLEVFRQRMCEFMAGFDLIVCPVRPYPAPLHGKLSTPRFNAGRWYTPVYNITGWPVVVVPVGTSNQGLPIGLQFVARATYERVALAAAGAVETALLGPVPPLSSGPLSYLRREAPGD